MRENTLVTIKATIDRFEEEKAVLLLGEHDEQRMNFPANLLPDGAEKGTSLIITVDIDRARTESLEKEILDLKDKLRQQTKKREQK